MTLGATRFHLYASSVCAGGLASSAWVLANETPEVLAAAPLLLWVLVGCVVVADLLPIDVVLRGREGVLSTSTAFAFATMIAFGPGAAVPALCLASVVGDVARHKPVARIGFNAGRYAIALTLTGMLMAAVTEVPRPAPAAFVVSDVPVLLACGLVFFVISTALDASLVALSGGIFTWFASDLALRFSTAILAVGLAPLMVIVGEFSVGMLPLLVLPTLAMHRNSRQAILSEHQALHDPLTGLPNRVLFHDRVRQAIESARRQAFTSAVMVVDLDHFKDINDSLGHYHGDRLLQLVGERLPTLLRGEDTVARMGGDEFAILLPSVSGQRRALDVAGKVLEGLRRSFEIDGLTLEVGASIGIACFPHHGDTGETLLQRADLAMYAAKSERIGARLYEDEQDRRSVRRLALAGELRRAIEHDELVLHHQPRIDVASGHVLGVEAFCRWQHPSLGLLAPGEFVPMAEHTGLVAPLTRTVLEMALEQAARWRGHGHTLSMAVNLSARCFLDARLLDDLPGLLSRWGVDAAVLELEITESMIAAEPELAGAVLDRLSGLGITLAIDGFGTGCSSLVHLRRLPVDEIKIDPSLVMEMSRGDETIVRSIIDLAHNLGLRAAAEGVEDQVILDRLRLLGCDIAQGFHVSRPLEAEAFAQWLESSRPVAPRQPEPRPAAAAA